MDPFTGDVWVGTGDDDHESALYFSKDNGETFHILGIGSQAYRALSMWFTKNYIYWNMDSANPQSIWRISRKNVNSNGNYKSLTPELNSGKTKVGLTYQVIKNSNIFLKFPVKQGKVYTETEERTLDTSNTVIVYNDASLDYKEKVAQLGCGSMWYTLNVMSKNKENITLMSTAPESNSYDSRSRVFGIQELKDTSVIVQELFTFPSPPISKNQISFSQLEPKIQDSNGNLYFKTREYFIHGLFKTELRWNDTIQKREIAYNNYKKLNLNSLKINSEYIKLTNPNNIITYPNPFSTYLRIYNKSNFNDK